MKDNKIVESFQITKKEIVSLLLTSLIFGAGIGFLCDYFVSLEDGIFHVASLWSGVILILLGTLALMLLVLPHKDKKIEINGLALLDAKKVEFIDIPVYSSPYKFYDFMKSLFSEKKAIKNHFISSFPDFRSGAGFKNANNEFRKITEEALEYALLDCFSSQTRYFYQNNEKKAEVLRRQDIPQILFTNRYIECFSSDMKNRDAFNETDNKSEKGEILAEWTSEDFYYSKFELFLPKHSSVTRLANGDIQIKTPQFFISFHISFEGFNGLVDDDFVRYYVGIKDYNSSEQNYIPYQFSMTIKIRYRFFSYFFKGENYKWIDSCISELVNLFSFKTFLNSISWEQTEALLRIVENYKNITDVALTDPHGFQVKLVEGQKKNDLL